jgi:hypothetical protein
MMRGSSVQLLFRGFHRATAADESAHRQVVRILRFVAAIVRRRQRDTEQDGFSNRPDGLETRPTPVAGTAGKK